MLVSVRARERQGVVRALEGLGGGVRARAQGCGRGAERRAGPAERAAPARKSRSASACPLRAARSGRRPGESGVCRVLKGKQLEITRSGQRRVWETRKAAGSVQSTAAFTCLGGGAHRVGEPGLSDRGNTVQRQRGPRSRLPFSSWQGLAEPLTSVCLKFLTCKVGVVTMFLSGFWGTVTMGKAPGTWRAPGALVSPLPGPIGCCIPDGRKYSRRPLGALGGVNTPARGPRAHSRMFDVLSLPRTIPSLSWCRWLAAARTPGSGHMSFSWIESPESWAVGITCASQGKRGWVCANTQHSPASNGPSHRHLAQGVTLAIQKRGVA